MKEWLAKNVGAVLRIAGILHLADGKESKELLFGETVQSAAEIGRYFFAHVKYAYDVMDSGNMLKMAEYVLSKLRQSGKSQTTCRELFRACRGSYFKQVSEKLKEMKIASAAKKLQDGFGETFTYMDFPTQHWTRIRMNNTIERMKLYLRKNLTLSSWCEKHN